MKVNATKTQITLFGIRPNLRRCPEVKINFSSNVITPSTNAKNLGVIFDPTLTWDDHELLSPAGASAS